MPPQELLLAVFRPVDDEMKARGGSPRRPGPPPRLTDSEVIAIELVGELWGLNDDTAILRHFRARHRAEFPERARTDRTRFVRHAADLCGLKRALQSRLADRLGRPNETRLIDSCPPPVCRFARSGIRRRFKGRAGFGHDPVAGKVFYGFRLHHRTGLDGVILGYVLAPGPAHELDLAREWAPSPVGTALGNRNYRGPATRAEFRAAGGDLVTPFQQAKHDPDPNRTEALMAIRRRIETTIGQLVDRLDCRRIRVRDLWRLEHRLVRKVFGHTVAAWLNTRDGHEPLPLGRPVA